MGGTSCCEGLGPRPAPVVTVVARGAVLFPTLVTAPEGTCLVDTPGLAGWIQIPAPWAVCPRGRRASHLSRPTSAGWAWAQCGGELSLTLLRVPCTDHPEASAQALPQVGLLVCPCPRQSLDSLWRIGTDRSANGRTDSLRPHARPGTIHTRSAHAHDAPLPPFPVPAALGSADLTERVLFAPLRKIWLLCEPESSWALPGGGARRVSGQRLWECTSGLEGGPGVGAGPARAQPGRSQAQWGLASSLMQSLGVSERPSHQPQGSCDLGDRVPPRRPAFHSLQHLGAAPSAPRLPGQGLPPRPGAHTWAVGWAPPRAGALGVGCRLGRPPRPPGTCVRPHPHPERGPWPP